MNDLEELVRTALHDVPAVVPAVHDPVAAVSSRVRRVRALWGGAVTAVVVAAVAVAVPLSLRNQTAGAGRLIPAGPSASASPLPSSAVPGVTVWGRDATSVAVGGGYLWELKRSSDGMAVVKVDPVSHEAMQVWPVPTGVERIAYGGGVVWLWSVSTNGDMVSLSGVVAALAVTAGGGAVASYPVTVDALDYLTVLPQSNGRGDALAVIGSSVRQLRLSGGAVQVVGAMALSAQASGPVVPTAAGAYWISDHGLRLLSFGAGADGLRVLASQPADTVPWDGPLLATGGGQDGIWTFDGSRVVDLSPALLHQGSSVSQGERLVVPGYPGAVVGDGVGGLFVVVVDGQVPVDGAKPGLYHLTKAAVAAGSGVVASTPSLAGVVPSQLAPDGHGGVDFVVNGLAEHWTG